MDHYGGKVTLSTTTQYGDVFEWFKDGEKITPDVYPHCVNCDHATLVISPFMPEYEGNYKCRVSNKTGYVESNDVGLSKSTLLIVSLLAISIFISKVWHVIIVLPRYR